MDAVSLLAPHIDILKLLEHYGFDRIREDGNMIRACCKIHGGNNPSAFVANRNNNLWFCHTGCSSGGDVYSLVQQMESCDFYTAVQRIAYIFHIDIGNLQIMERKAEYVNEMQRWLRLMRSRMQKRAFQEYAVNVPINSVTKFRSFETETLEYFGLQFVKEFQAEKRDGGTYVLHDRLLVPIRFNGMQVGISLRRTKSSDHPKWSHQPLDFESSEILYNYDAVLGSPLIAVVEGTFDVWAYHEIGIPAVCTFGAHLTDEQYRLLIKSGADIALSYDGDKAGKIATEKAIKLLKYKCNLSVVPFDENQDPETISREELRLAFENKRRV